MQPSGRIPAALFLLLLIFCAGCNRDPKKFLAKGNTSFDQGKYPEALIHYGRHIQLDPRYAEAHFKLAQTQLKLKSWSAAFAELQRTVELQPENWEAQIELGQLQLASGKRQEAKDRAQLVLKSNPNNVDAQLLLSDAEAALGNSADSFQAANDAVKMAPDRAATYPNLAQLQMRAGKPGDAESNLLKAQSLEPKAITSYMMLGALYHQLKRDPDSEKQFQAAIAVAPQEISPRSTLASLYYSQGHVEQAEQVLTDAKNQLSSNPIAYRMLGDSYLSRGQFEKAAIEFAALSAKYPDDLSVQTTYIQLLILNNRLDDASPRTEAILKKSGRRYWRRRGFDESAEVGPAESPLFPEDGRITAGAKAHGRRRGDVPSGPLPRSEFF